MGCSKSSFRSSRCLSQSVSCWKMECKCLVLGTIAVVLTSAHCNNVRFCEAMNHLRYRIPQPGLRGFRGTGQNTSGAIRGYPKVETSSGRVVGVSTDQAHVFYEIPYAEPPVGNLRFQDPRPLASPLPEINATLSTYLQCTQYSNSCTGALDDPCPINAKEDCLVLNIFVPPHVNLTQDIPPEERLPVMFYIHGGYYKINAGTDSRTHGEELCKTVNSVVVAINYRLGALGFLSHVEEGLPDLVGNQGMKDQLLALQWIHENIGKFGGDKTKILLFGNSAGAQSVMFHTIWEKSEDLYSYSIQQSNPNIFSLRYSDFPESLIISDSLVRAIGCKNASSERQCLLELPAQDIIDQMAFVEEEMTIYFGSDVARLRESFTPIVDGIEFTDQPVNLYRDGKWHKYKPMIMGINTEEFVDRAFSQPPDEEFDENDFIQLLVKIFGDEYGSVVAEKYIAAYPPKEGNNYLFTYYKLETQYSVVCPSRLMARYAANTSTSSVYYYVNSHPILIEECVKQNAGNKTGCYLSTHASEIRYVFRTVNEKSEEYTDSDCVVENEFSTYWGSFARTGDPSNGIEKDLGSFPEWPPYTAHSTYGDSRPWPHMHIQAPASEVDYGYTEEICDFWDEINYGLPNRSTAAHATLWTTAICFAITQFTANY